MVKIHLHYSISAISNRDILHALLLHVKLPDWSSLVSSVIISIWPNNAKGIWLSTPLIACLCYYRVRSGNGAILIQGCLAAMIFPLEVTSQPWLCWHLRSHCGFGLSVLQGEQRETQMLHITRPSRLIVPWKLPPWLGWTENHCSIDLKT